MKHKNVIIRSFCVNFTVVIFAENFSDLSATKNPTFSIKPFYLYEIKNTNIILEWTDNRVSEDKKGKQVYPWGDAKESHTVGAWLIVAAFVTYST